jgi:hypothetical protein
MTADKEVEAETPAIAVLPGGRVTLDTRRFLIEQ